MLKQNIQYNQFVTEFSNLINAEKQMRYYNNITFLCIGTSRVVGDSIGPLVGTKLKENLKNNKLVKIIGDCNNNIHYQNIENTIKAYNPESILIVIDSALSNKENIGKIFVQTKGLKYGEGIKKPSYNIGNISIKAVVEKNTKNKFINFYKLKKTSNLRVEFLANLISAGIVQVMNS